MGLLYFFAVAGAVILLVIFVRVTGSREATAKTIMRSARAYQARWGMEFGDALVRSLEETRPRWKRDPALVESFRELVDEYGDDPGTSEEDLVEWAVTMERNEGGLKMGR